MGGEAFADSPVTHCHARRSSLKTSLTRLSRRPKSQSLYPAGRGVAFHLAFRLTGQPPEKHACVGVPRAYRRCSRNLRKLDGRFSAQTTAPHARTVAYVSDVMVSNSKISHARHTRIRLVPLAGERFDPAM